MRKAESSMIRSLEDSTLLEIQVKLRSKKFKIRFNDVLTVSCTQPPIKGKVNHELIRELSKIFNTKVEIVSGHHSRRKRILLKNITEKETRKILTMLVT